MLTVAVLLIVAEGVKKTGAINPIKVSRYPQLVGVRMGDL